MSFRKILCFLGLAASLSVSAGVYQCKKGDVSLPCDFNGWDVGGDALYLKQTGGSVAHAAFGPQLFNQDAAWGLRIEASRHFGNGNDFNINWAYFNQSQSMTDNGGTLYGRTQSFNTNDYMSMVNLELGQQIHFGEKWGVRAHMGLSILNLKDQAQTTPGVPITDVVHTDAVGARLGVDSAYHLWEGLSFYTNGAISGFYANQFAVGNPNGVFARSFPNRNQPLSGNMTDGLFGLDFNIGLEYSYPVAEGDITGRVGWVDYNFSGTTFIGDFAWQGLIFGAKWVGNA